MTLSCFFRSLVFGPPLRTASPRVQPVRIFAVEKIRLLAVEKGRGSTWSRWATVKRFCFGFTDGVLNHYGYVQLIRTLVELTELPDHAVMCPAEYVGKSRTCTEGCAHQSGPSESSVMIQHAHAMHANAP
jgi:hypothetical protein